jgi:hypothetical protein
LKGRSAEHRGSGIKEGALATEGGAVRRREGSKYGLDDYLSIKYLCQGGLE